MTTYLWHIEWSGNGQRGTLRLRFPASMSRWQIIETVEKQYPGYNVDVLTGMGVADDELP